MLKAKDLAWAREQKTGTVVETRDHWLRAKLEDCYHLERYDLQTGHAVLRKITAPGFFLTWPLI